MKLSSIDKYKLRKLIEDKVKDVPEGQRIKLDKDLLENLIFEKEMSISNNTITKFVVWSGDFLSKIDLSEVDFDNVLWNIEYSKNHLLTWSKNYYEKIASINLSNTNVNIDFNKSYDRFLSFPIINSCNFENVDLSQSNIDKFKKINNCNLKNSKIIIKEENSSIGFYKCNLENNDLSNLTVDIEQICHTNDDLCFWETNLKNTGIHIEYDYGRPDQYRRKLKRYYSLKEIDFKDDKQEDEYAYLQQHLRPFIRLDSCGEDLGTMIKNGELDGCYVNDKLILSKEKQVIKRKKTLEELQNLKNNYIKVISDSIDSQIKSLKKINTDTNNN